MAVHEARISAADIERIAREQVPMVGRLGLRVERIGFGEVLMCLPYREEFVRPGGTIAGPVMMLLADFVMYAVVLSLVGPVELAVTTSLNINFLRRPKATDLHAHGRILKLGKRLAVGEVTLHCGDPGHPVAHVTSTYSIPPGAT